MLAFTHSTIPKILDSVDFLNIMTYDLMNRRDNVTKHHTGVQLSREAIDTYLHRGVPPQKANLGLAFYVKWFKTAPDADDDCQRNPVGCKTELMEDASTGADLGNAGAFSWHDEVPAELSESFSTALAQGVYDTAGGGHYYWDRKERLFWTWDTPSAIESKVALLVQDKKLGGVFAWGLGEDAPKFKHLRAANEALRRLSAVDKVQLQERSEL
jgi:GH18 family chitinase